MKPSKKNQLSRFGSESQRGTSLVELVIALGLMSILGVGITLFFRNVDYGSAILSAKSDASSTNKRLIELLKRDVKFSTSYALIDSGKGLEITRRQLYDPADSNATFKVTYHSECVSPSGNALVTNFINNHYTANARAVFSKVSTQCLAKLDCKNGEFPRIAIATVGTGPRIPAYGVKAFPDLLNSSKKISLATSSFGSALCLQASGNKIRMVVESVYALSNGGPESQVAVVGEEILLSQSQFTNLEVLPNR